MPRYVRLHGELRELHQYGFLCTTFLEKLCVDVTRLNNNRGTAILLAASIYDACHCFRLFQVKTFGQYCGIIT
jgi:hypothetical protein